MNGSSSFSRITVCLSAALSLSVFACAWSAILPNDSDVIARGERGERSEPHSYQHQGMNSHNEYNHQGNQYDRNRPEYDRNNYGNAHHNVNVWEGNGQGAAIYGGQGTQYVPYPTSDLPPLPPQQQ